MSVKGCTLGASFMEYQDLPRVKLRARAKRYKYKRKEATNVWFKTAPPVRKEAAWKISPLESQWRRDVRVRRARAAEMGGHVTRHEDGRSSIAHVRENTRTRCPTEAFIILLTRASKPARKQPSCRIFHTVTRHRGLYLAPGRTRGLNNGERGEGAVTSALEEWAV